jgi:uncharacterized repeat protein (TIGR03803 family)
MLRNQPGCFALARRATAVLCVLIVSFLLLAGLSEQALSQTYKVIHNFTVSDGATPYAGPTLDRLGNVYGTTYLGGSSGNGSVYKLSRRGSSWVFRSLYSFTAGSDGSGPGFGSLAFNSGSLFGTTEGGGNFGTAFEVWRANPGSGLPDAWKESVVHSFGSGKDGAQPLNGVVFDAAGNFYGTTSLNGAYGNGAVYEVRRSGKKWIESVIYSFKDANPVAGVTLDAHGNLYGTTSFGGPAGDGVVFKLSRSGSGWKETVLYSFQGGNDGQHPVGGLVLGKAGNMYGSTFQGGANGGGTVYELSRSGKGWKLTTLYSFSGGFAGPYNKLTFDAKGNIYGATNGDGAHGFGSVFKLTRTTSGWKFTDLYDFTNGSDGGSPYGSVAVDAQGNIFGTAAVGGSDNQGVVFQIMP